MQVVIRRVTMMPEWSIADALQMVFPVGAANCRGDWSEMRPDADVDPPRTKPVAQIESGDHITIAHSGIRLLSWDLTSAASSSIISLVSTRYTNATFVRCPML